MTQRIHYDKPTYYSTRVLVGPWVEERSSFTREEYKHSSTYSDFFGPKPNSRVDPAFQWDLKLNSEDSNFISQIGKSEHPNFFENFSTTYDLAYNHYPKCCKSYIPRVLRFRLSRFEPVDDYLPSFGNITSYGLVTNKKKQWGCEVQDPRLTYATNYKDTFSPPKMEDYKFKRWSIPISNSSIMDGNNRQSVSLRLRNKPLSNVPQADQLVEVPRESPCNPITWECSTKKGPNCKSN